MAISDWPPGERPRERLLMLGAAALSDAELLAMGREWLSNQSDCQERP